MLALTLTAGALVADPSAMTPDLLTAIGVGDLLRLARALPRWTSERWSGALRDGGSVIGTPAAVR